jgi:bacillithiol biosynthesis cysteine-adding enzyme BshC
MIKSLNRRLYNLFYEDYISNKSDAYEFIVSPHQISWDKLTGSLDLNSPRYQKTRQLLINQNKDLTTENAKKYLEDLENPESVILITGQQLGLFASPLYTIYKIISTIKLAEDLNKQKKKYKYVPVFWLETEDHDFREINHLGLLDKQFQPKQLIYEGKDRGKVSLRHYQLESSITSFISDVKENLLDTEFTQDLFVNLNDYYKPERDWTSAVRRFLKGVFNSSGLLFFHPGDSEIKKFSVDFFTQLVLKGEELRESFDKQSEKLISKGYQNQVKNISGQTFIHIEQENNQREHLYKDGDVYFFKDSDKQYNQTDILTKIKDDPTSVSSTVVSRPLLQSWLLPVAAYIAGPGEIAYWAQLSQMFKDSDLVMPALYPRISATIIEPKIAKYLEKYSIDIEELPTKKNLFIENYIKLQSENEDDNPFKSLNQLLENEGTKVDSYLKALDPTLVEAGIKSIERMKQTLENLENRIIKVKEQKNTQLTNHLQQTHSSFFPQELPQERFQSLVYYLNKFGPEIVDTLYSELSIEEFNHQLLYL